MNRKQLLREMKTVGVPVLAVGVKRVALGGEYKTATGQWAIEADGAALWHGHGAPTPEPSAALLAEVAIARSAHVPEDTRDPYAEVTKREMLDAILDPAKLETLRTRLTTRRVATP